MDGDLFDSTIPFGAPELMRAASYRRYLDELPFDTTGSGAGTRLSQLSPSLQADLLRFEAGDGNGNGSDAVQVLAACLRHAARLTIHLQCADHVVPLTVFAPERQVHCPMDLGELVERHLAGLRVMHVEPAQWQPPDGSLHALVDAARRCQPLAPLLWELALRGPRRELLPEISGPAVYRVAPGLDMSALPASGALKAAVQRLRRQAANLTEIAGWPALDRERAARLLNALYLQAGLIVSRSHPAAVRESWFGGL